MKKILLGFMFLFACLLTVGATSCSAIEYSPPFQELHALGAGVFTVDAATGAFTVCDNSTDIARTGMRVAEGSTYVDDGTRSLRISAVVNVQDILVDNVRVKTLPTKSIIMQLREMKAASPDVIVTTHSVNAGGSFRVTGIVAADHVRKNVWPLIVVGLRKGVAGHAIKIQGKVVSMAVDPL